MNSPKFIEAQVICRGPWAPGVTRASTSSERISRSSATSSLGRGTCAGDHVQPFPPVARAFLLLSILRQQLLQHAANVSAHFSIARALRLFAVAHRSSPLSTAAVFATGGASVTVHS